MFPKIKIKNIIYSSALLTIGFFIFLIPPVAFAADGVSFTPNVSIGKDVVAGDEKKVDSETLAKYLMAIYKYAIGAVGIIATVVMMTGGVIWITAGGNKERITSAQAWIGAAVSGLVLAVGSYTILYLVNTNLLTFRAIVLKKPEEIKKDVSKVCAHVGQDCGSSQSKDSIPAPCIESCNCGQESIEVPGLIFGKTYRWTCKSDGVQVEGADGLVWQNDNAKIKSQYEDADEKLKDLLTCMRKELNYSCGTKCGQISSISDEKFMGDQMATCRQSDCPTGKTGCVHKCNSCHYGGNASNKSLAADFGDQGNADKIKAAAISCGAQSKDIFYGDPEHKEHIHVGIDCK